jgi:ring-1,2-phenylacetyl-CoA epoxidase subunit PaaD
MVTPLPSVEAILGWLEAIPDPEIPVLSILDLGIVRDVAWTEEDGEPMLAVAVTPTYSGCPAIRTIEGDIVRELHARGIANVALGVRLSPPWTTDWLTATGREKLRAYGISPPRLRAVEADAPFDLGALEDERARCPRCDSDRVELVSRYGSTPCKALYRCGACREPFDHFKTH